MKFYKNQISKDPEQAILQIKAEALTSPELKLPTTTVTKTTNTTDSHIRQTPQQLACPETASFPSEQLA